jgi:hypothetical protein
MKPRQQSRREGKRSDTPNVDAVRFDNAADANVAFERFKSVTRRLIAVPKAEIAKLAPRRKRARR